MTTIKSKKRKEFGASTQRSLQPMPFKLVSAPTKISWLDR
jgi:hypothetical protein